MRWVILFLLFVFLGIYNQREVSGSGKDTWVAETLSKLSLDEKIAQLMMIEVRPSKGREHLEEVDTLISRYKVGGVIFFKTDAQNLFLSAQKYQSLSRIPLLVGIDGEWGVSMRVDNTIMYPYQVGLGGIQDESLLYEMGKDIGRQCRRLGIHLNFAPVIDVNNNPDNPVINFRSFGENPDNVGRKGWLYAKGMQDEGVIACAKHFPGHGDTKTDSHKDLPAILHNRSRLDSVELKPFKYLVDSGVMAVMTAHVYMPAIDTTTNRAMSLSPLAVNGLLKNELGFKGLAVTDALDMQGVSKFYPRGTLELNALLAGNDLLLCPADVPRAIDTIRKAVLEGVLAMEELDAKVKKVLEAKLFAGLDIPEDLFYNDLVRDLNNQDAVNLYKKLVQHEICVARNDSSFIPLYSKPYRRMAAVSLGGSGLTEFEQLMKAYGDCELFSVNKVFGETYCTNIVNTLQNYDMVVVGLHQINKYPKDNYGITEDICNLVERLKKKTRVAVVCFGNPYSMRAFTGLHTTVFAFGDTEPYHQAAASAVWGMTESDARLSVSVGTEYPLASGHTLYKTDVLQPLTYVTRAHHKLFKIDTLVKRAIDQKAMPGCQVLIAKNGRIMYQKSFGKHTYDKSPKVKDDHLYDIASVTKIAATTLAIMKLTETGRIQLDDTLSDYLPELLGSDKQHITIREILLHESGLKDFIPFYTSFKSDPSLRDSMLSGTITETFCYEVNDGIFVNRNYLQYMLAEIANSPLGQKGKYVYSDLGMIMLRVMIERVSGNNFEDFLDTHFYKPMGLKYLTFNPRLKFLKEQIAPTEKDPDFRKGVLQGYVHDPSAALLGGVSGHAGLFSNASDLAEIGQMLLNYGFYNGKRLLKAQTVIEFTARQHEGSRRGLGFDKPETEPGKSSPASSHASALCFGHTGFTGTCMWVDPPSGLVYVFLSNRVYPSAENRKLITKNVRTEIMDAFYEAIR